jgi:GT2 family glycosyltransferase
MTGFEFPPPDRPEVSIVIPAFGDWEWLTRSLGSVLANTEPCYELIVVDNDSPDDVSSRLAASTENVRIVRNRKNFGFGPACNQGAAYARGEFLVFLNSDALVHAGWLAPLLDTARGNRRIGAVGPLFLNHDGSVQEAGALLSGDALTGAYGAGHPPASADLDRPRAVDYVSAACLTVRRLAFDEIGGFDPIYVPAYYEDVDLCLTLASRGYLTMFEPRSVVTHVHGWSAEKSVDASVMARNRAIFARRWSHILASRPLTTSDGVKSIIASRDAPLLDRLLVVSERIPEKGSRSALLLRELASLCPAANVALLARDAALDRNNGLRAVEIAPVEGELERARDWLASRRFHYDAVLSLPPRLDSLEREVRNTQPQASWIVDLGGETVEQAARDEAVESLETVQAVMVASEEARQAIATKAPRLPVFLVGEVEMRRQVLEVLTHLGFAAGLSHFDDQFAPLLTR